MKAKTFIDSAKTVIAIEGNAVLELAKQIQPTFDDLCKEIIQLKGKLILMGIGKSGHVAQKISATLSSTGTPSFFIHPTEAAHGDLGMVGKNDAILIFSNSGETKEIIEILNEKIAKYKIPKLFIWIDELPINAMGKVQKKNLRIKYEKILL